MASAGLTPEVQWPAGGGGDPTLSDRAVLRLGAKKRKLRSQLLGEAAPLSEEEAEDSVDDDDEVGEHDPNGASDVSNSEDADDEFDFSFKKSNVVKSDSAIVDQWMDALHLNRDVVSSAASQGVKKLIKKLTKKWAGDEDSAFRQL